MPSPPVEAAMAEELLNTVVTDRDVGIIARDHLVKWEDISPFLDLKHVTDEDIRRTPGGYKEQKKEFLKEWKRQHGPRATFRVLIEAAEEAGNMRLADDLRTMLQNRRVKSHERTSVLFEGIVFISALSPCRS